MGRTQIHLEDASCEAVRRRASEQGRSTAEAFGASAARPRRVIDFTFIGMGCDPDPPGDVPVSVDHDRWYADAIASRWEDERGRS